MGGFGGLFGIGDISGLVQNMFDGMFPAGLTEFEGTYTKREDGEEIMVLKKNRKK